MTAVCVSQRANSGIVLSNEGCYISVMDVMDEQFFAVEFLSWELFFVWRMPVNLTRTMGELQGDESLVRKIPKCMVLLTQHGCAEYIHIMPLEVMHP